MNDTANRPPEQNIYIGLYIKSVRMPTARKRAELTIAFARADEEYVLPMLAALMEQCLGGLLAPVNIRGLRLVWQDYTPPAKEEPNDNR